MTSSVVVSDAKVCRYCKIRAVNGPKCVQCDTVLFHPKCGSRLNLNIVNKSDVVCCGDLGKVESLDKNNTGSPNPVMCSGFGGVDVVTVLKSKEFASIVSFLL